MTRQGFRPFPLLGASPLARPAGCPARQSGRTIAAMSDQHWTDYEISYGRKPMPKKPSAITSLAQWVTVAVFIGAIFAGAIWGIARVSVAARAKFHEQMVAEAFQQYKIVEQGDDLMAKCLHAGVVAEAFLMAKDADNYHKWKKIADGWDALARRQIEAETKAQIRRFSR